MIGTNAIHEDDSTKHPDQTKETTSKVDSNREDKPTEHLDQIKGPTSEEGSNH
jgi:hypothetical protein